jgi:hypothetical protein
MTRPAGDHEADWRGIDRTAMGKTSQAGAVIGEFKRFALSANSMTPRAFVPLWEAHSWCGAARAHLHRTGYIFPDRSETKMTNLQHRLETRLTNAEGRQVRYAFPVLKPHWHKGPLLQVHNRPDAEGRDEL